MAAAVAALSGACTAAPPNDSPLPDSAFRVVNGGVVFDDWPRVARRAWPQSGHKGMPAGFTDEVLISGLERPTALRFLPDGSVLVTEQQGVLKLFPAADRHEPRVLLDLRTEVLVNYQLGLLALAVDPDFGAEPYVYLAYTRDAPLGGQPPTYGAADGADECPARHACPASARLVRYRLEGTPLSATTEEVLIDDWCIAGPNHTIGTIAFGPDGALYAGAGDGADGQDPDYGQLGPPLNVCDDPHLEGGSLRSQDLSVGDDPVSLDGTIVRVDRTTGEGVRGNPLFSSADANARRIVAYGLRNPFRFIFRPGTEELWIGDVGWNGYEEIDRLVDSAPPTAANFGWPCFEGPEIQPDWRDLDLEPCADLYTDEGAVEFPTLSFARPAGGDDAEACASESSALSGVAFYDGTLFPERFRGALFFADTGRECLFVVEAGDDGLPDPHTMRLFSHPIRLSDLVVGPDGALYYTQVVRGELHRISWR